MEGSSIDNLRGGGVKVTADSWHLSSNVLGSWCIGGGRLSLGQFYATRKLVMHAFSCTGLLVHQRE
eukprot:scaffold16392_cov15-Tisochrysis_lutea.AAC.3